MTSEAKEPSAESDRFYIGEAAHGSSYIIDRASQRSAIGRSGSFVVVIDSGEASWVCAALNEKQDRDNVAEVEPTGERYRRNRCPENRDGICYGPQPCPYRCESVTTKTPGEPKP